ncbi:MAG: glycosyltransferase family 2 protein [Desulfobacterales bacterium]|nr:glycosyltransferase family 2 protein [Desulfobacterales bacterium]
MTIDISIVTYNSEQHIEELIQSLTSLEFNLKQVTLLFHDNNSKDNTLEILNKTIPNIKDKFSDIIINPHADNIGFGKAQNLSISKGSSEFVFILNPDVKISLSCLKILYETAKSDVLNFVAWEARQAPFEHPKIYNPVTLETPWASGAALFIKRTVFEEIGGFDPNFFMYGEDIDLSFKLRENGWKIKYVPKAIVWHYTYSNEGEIKPFQVLGAINANLILRAIYGTWIDIIKGMFMCFKILLSPSKIFFRQKKKIFQNIFNFIKNIKFYRSLAKNKKNKIKFYKWDYCPMRRGAFHDISDGINLLDKKNNNLPLVSVLVRTVGKKLLLKQALQSIANQTYPNIEIIIVEDGNKSVNDVIEDFKNLKISYYSTGKKVERCISGNLAMEKAIGDYFIFLDDDDLFYADHIEQLVSAVLKNNTKIAYSSSFEIPTEIDKNTGEIIAEGKYKEFYNEQFSFFNLIACNCFPNNSILFDKSLFHTCGGFDPELVIAEDWNLWLKFSLKIRNFLPVPKTTSLYRVPYHKKDYAKRHAILLKAFNKAKAKHSTFEVTLKISELEELIEKSSYSGLSSALSKRFPKITPIINAMAKTYRFFRQI